MISKLVLEELYNVKRLSMSEIAQLLSCSVHKVDYWMKAYKIIKRNRSEANYIKHNPTGNPFNIKNELNAEELFLKGLALGIFWGEGNKKNLHSVRVGNTDPVLIGIFTKFLRTICNVDERKIRFGLQLFTDVDEKLALEFWMKELNISRNQILPTISRIQSGKIGTYKSKNHFGVMTVQVNNMKLRDWIVDQIVQISPSSSVVERIHGRSQEPRPLREEISERILNNG